eukprot:scaffold10333_cov64-Phaeocystis_antarctica.AAC.1
MLVERAVTCSLAASLAYLSPGQLAATRRQWRHTGPALTAPPGQRYAARLAKDYTFAEQVLDPTLQASCTIFESEDELCVAFRGATSARNLRSTLSERLVPLDAPEPDGARTHEGYREASLRLYERLQPALERRGASARRVVFTGHAYGGGTATLSNPSSNPDPKPDPDPNPNPNANPNPNPDPNPDLDLDPDPNPNQARRPSARTCTGPMSC